IPRRLREPHRAREDLRRRRAWRSWRWLVRTRHRPRRPEHGLLDHLGRLRLRHRPRRRRLHRRRLHRLALLRGRALLRRRCDAEPVAADARFGAAADDPVPAGRARLAPDAPAQKRRGVVMSAILAVENLEKTFGSLVAARDINVSIPAEQTVGVIGANGAGKTTFINMITGHLTPTKGTIRFEDRDITGKPSREITRLGISRSFQVAQVFP